MNTLQEALASLWDRLVDRDDDPDGTHWQALDPGSDRGSAALAYRSEEELRAIRGQCRQLALGNEFAINGHENRISYIVGTGHNYRAMPREEADDQLAAAVQAVVEQFVRQSKWHQRQQEIVRRKDRDGEVFLHFFFLPDGTTQVRFVEPEQVATPPDRRHDLAAAFGILTTADDVETVRGYFIDGRLVPADEIQHRKANVDANARRGLPLFHAVGKNLRRAEKLLRNMSVVAEIQSAIALIRKHATGTRGALEQFVAGGADATLTSRATGRTSHFRRYGPGTILDALAGVDYQFPAAGIDPSRFVAVLQAELRAIASRLVMPEFMLTSDASNANYASTMVAEGPAVKMFQRLQHEMLEDDLEVMWRVVAHAADRGRLPSAALDHVEIRGIPPTLAVRDRLQDARADQILVQAGAMSVQTMAMRQGLDPDRESRLRRQLHTAAGPEGGLAQTYRKVD